MTAPETVSMRPHPLRSLPVGVMVAPGRQIDWGDWWLAGWSFRETTGAAVAQLDLIDGADGNGVMIASLAVAAGGSVSHTIGGHLLEVRTGLWVTVGAGSVVGALWVMPRTERGDRRR